MATLLLVVIWGSALHLIAVEHAATIESAIESSRELGETYDAQMVRNLGAIDQTLRLVKYAYELRNATFSLGELRDKGLLPSSLVFDVAIADRDGNTQVEAGRSKLPNVAAASYFTAHRQVDTGQVYVSRALLDTASAGWVLRFSRRLDAPDGTFDGIAMLAVDPAYFTSGYERSRLGSRGVVGLLGADGEFRVKRTADDTTSGQQVNYAQAAESSRGKLANGDLLTNPWDGVRRFTTAYRLHGYPLTVVVGLDEDEQLAEFRAHRRNYVLEAISASVLLVMAVLMLGRMSWQLSRSRRRMRKLQETYYAASEASVEAFFVLRAVRDGLGRIIDFSFGDTNSRGEQIVGTDKRDLIGKTVRQVLPGAFADGLLEDLIGVATTGITHESEWRNASPILHAEWLYRQVVKVEDGVVAIMRDISERKRLEMKVQYQATHDTLTGLANRHLLDDRLSTAIAHATRYGHTLWVVFVDLDRFKLVNDSLGHKAGDTVLTTIAARLRGALREMDTVSRMGGDEFVLVLPGGDEVGPSTGIIARIMEVIAAPIVVEEKDFLLGCSIGISVYPGDGTTAGQLIERADIAMYRAKETGRNNFQFFTDEMNRQLMERLRIEGSLRAAVERSEFVLHYQPQLDLRTGKMVGIEALIRWQHPEMGMVSPARFIGVAEETGLIVPIGLWVLRTACAQNVAWQRAGAGELCIAVNLSARQFREPNLVQSIDVILQETGLPPRLLEIELTEGLVMTDVDNVISILHDLKSLGVALSIDDFGTGYSSLSYLKRFPIDVLKIDQSFVRDIADGGDDETIVASIISLAHSLRLRVIAEGVETATQLAYLRRHRCDQMQGYYFSRPLPAGELEALLRSGKHLPPD